MPRQFLTLVARSLPCLTVTLPCSGGVTSRTAGKGPAVQSLRMVAKIPALMSVSGLPLTSRCWTAPCWAKARVGCASSAQSAASVGHFIVGSRMRFADVVVLWTEWIPGVVGDLDQHEKQSRRQDRYEKSGDRSGDRNRRARHERNDAAEHRRGIRDPGVARECARHRRYHDE